MLIGGRVNFVFVFVGDRVFFEVENAFFWGGVTIFYINHWKNAINPRNNMKIKIELPWIWESHNWDFTISLYRLETLPKLFVKICEMKRDNFYHLEYSNYYFHFYFHNVLADMSFSLL